MRISGFMVAFVFGQTVWGQNPFVDETTPVDAVPYKIVFDRDLVIDFSDEFNSPEINLTKWNIDNSSRSRAPRPAIGITDWRWKSENVEISDGNLVLKVYKSDVTKMTNGSVNSFNKYERKYGYFEVKMKIGDSKRGTHSAFWLQGRNMSNVDGTANDGAEIDVFESAWIEDYTKSVIHIDGYGIDHKANTKRYETPGIHDGYHIWGFYWDENCMKIYYDGELKVNYSDSKWLVHSEEYLWLSNGASFGVSGDQYFLDLPIGYLTETKVDYIRVWKFEDANLVIPQKSDKKISVYREADDSVRIKISAPTKSVSLFSSNGLLIGCYNDMDDVVLNAGLMGLYYIKVLYPDNKSSVLKFIV